MLRYYHTKRESFRRKEARLTAASHHPAFAQWVLESINYGFL